MHKRRNAADAVLDAELKTDNSGHEYVEAKCMCTKTMPRVVYMHRGLDSRYFVGTCWKCNERYIVRIGK